MARILDKSEYRIPTWAVSAIYYDDYTGLTDEEEEAVKTLLYGIYKAMGKNFDLAKVHGHWSVEPNVESHFSWHNDIWSQGGDVIEMTYVIMESASQREA